MVGTKEAGQALRMSEGERMSEPHCRKLQQSYHVVDRQAYLGGLLLSLVFGGTLSLALAWLWLDIIVRSLFLVLLVLLVCLLCCLLSLGVAGIIKPCIRNNESPSGMRVMFNRLRNLCVAMGELKRFLPFIGLGLLLLGLLCVFNFDNLELGFVLFVALGLLGRVLACLSNWNSHCQRVSISSAREAEARREISKETHRVRRDKAMTATQTRASTNCVPA